MKLGISSQDLQDFILPQLDLVRNISSTGKCSAATGKTNPKLGVEN
jgi:hypothetical protein